MLFVCVIMCCISFNLVLKATSEGYDLLWLCFACCLFCFVFIFPLRTMPCPSRARKVVRSSGPLVPQAQHRRAAPLASTASTTRPTPTETIGPASVVTPNATMVQGISKAVYEAVIQSLTPFMVSDQSASASTLTETPVQDAPVNTSPNFPIGADATVQGSVASVIHTLSGEPLTGVALAQPHDRPGDIVSSMSLPIDARVTAKLKAKIGANEFINLGQLITVTPMEDKFNISNNTSKDSPGQPTLCLEPLQKGKNINTIDTWTSAFQIFVGIYTSEFPAEAPALMKYGEVVRDLAAKGANWIYYDTNFRYLRQQKPTDFPWGNIHFELWIRSQQFPTPA